MFSEGGRAGTRAELLDGISDADLEAALRRYVNTAYDGDAGPSFVSAS